MIPFYIIALTTRACCSTVAAAEDFPTVTCNNTLDSSVYGGKVCWHTTACRNGCLSAYVYMGYTYRH